MPPIQPNIKTPLGPTGSSTCIKCGLSKPLIAFAPTHSKFFPNGRIPLCNDCAARYIEVNGGNWEIVDKLCQQADIPFVVKEWQRICDLNPGRIPQDTYSMVFAADCYKSLGWDSYYKQYKALKEAGMAELEIPLLAEKHYNDLRRIQGANYSEEELDYLSDLYEGLLVSQNISGALQTDQARKICKLSLELDNRLRSGDKDIDKIMSTYDKLTKAAEFTPKNTKNAVDFDSIAELALWVEKRGYQNKFYDDVARDVVDETLRTIEAYNQHLYTNEGGIGDVITDRLRALDASGQAVNVDKSSYGLQELGLKDKDIDGYANATYTMMEFGDDEEFDPTSEDTV